MHHGIDQVKNYNLLIKPISNYEVGFIILLQLYLFNHEVED